MTDQELIEELESQRGLMVTVATGRAQIDDRNAEYRERRQRIRAELQRRGIPDPNPFADLWAWYGRWSSGDLPSYQSRRVFVSELYQPLIDSISTPSAQPAVEPTGWARVDRDLGEMNRRLEEARTPTQHQAVGLFAREILLHLAQEVYDPTRHASTDGIAPGPGDAKRMLDAYISTELSGSSNKELRNHAKAALDVANKVTHGRSGEFRAAALAAEATRSVVSTIAIISGRRDPQGE